MFFVKISVQIRPNSVIFRSKFKLFDWSTQLKFVPNFLNFPKFVPFGGLRNFLTFESQNLATPPLSSPAARHGAAAAWGCGAADLGARRSNWTSAARDLDGAARARQHTAGPWRRRRRGTLQRGYSKRRRRHGQACGAGNSHEPSTRQEGVRLTRSFGSDNLALLRRLHPGVALRA